MKSVQLDEMLISWIWEMYDKGIAISGSVIQEKAANLLATINHTLPSEKQITVKFSSGSLWRLKKRNNFSDLFLTEREPTSMLQK